MKDKRKYLLLAVIASAIVSCQNSEGRKVRERMVQKGQTVIKQLYSTDDKLLSEQECITRGRSLIPNGFYKEYYTNEGLKHLSFTSFGKASGNTYEFYNNAVLKSIVTSLGDSIHFKPDGSQIDKRPMFSFSTTFDTVVIGSVIPVFHELIVLRHIETSIKSQLFDSSQSLIWEKVRLKQTDGYDVSIFHNQEILKFPGRYRYVATATYIDSATRTPLLAKTLEFNFVVMKEPRKTQSKK